MALSTCTGLCNHPRHQSPELSIFPNWNMDSPPPPPSPCHLLPVSVALTPLGTPPVRGMRQQFTFCVWLISPTMSSRYIHVLACARTPSLSKAEYYFKAWIRHSVLTQQFAETSLGCSHLSAVGTNAVMNTGVQISVRSLLSICLCLCPEAGLRGRLGTRGTCRTAVHSGSAPHIAAGAPGSTFSTKDTAFDHPRLTLVVPLNFTNSMIKLSHIPEREHKKQDEEREKKVTPAETPTQLRDRARHLPRHPTRAGGTYTAEGMVTVVFSSTSLSCLSRLASISLSSSSSWVS